MKVLDRDEEGFVDISAMVLNATFSGSIFADPAACLVTRTVLPFGATRALPRPIFTMLGRLRLDSPITSVVRRLRQECRRFPVHGGGALRDKQLHPRVYSGLSLNHDLERAAQSHLNDGRLVCFAIVQALHTSYKSTCHIKQTCD
jgi:hypothetical protein